MWSRVMRQLRRAKNETKIQSAGIPADSKNQCEALNICAPCGAASHRRRMAQRSSSCTRIADTPTGTFS